MTSQMLRALRALAADPQLQVWGPTLRELRQGGLIERDLQRDGWWPTAAGLDALADLLGDWPSERKSLIRAGRALYSCCREPHCAARDAWRKLDPEALT